MCRTAAQARKETRSGGGFSRGVRAATARWTSRAVLAASRPSVSAPSDVSDDRTDSVPDATSRALAAGAGRPPISGSGTADRRNGNGLRVPAFTEMQEPEPDRSGRAGGRMTWPVSLRRDVGKSPGYATVRIAGGGPTQLLLGRSVLTLRVGLRGRSYRVAAPSGHREHSADSDQDQGQHPARADSGVTPVKATTWGGDVHDGWSMGGGDKPIGLL
jgi:hypothetical protein